MANIHELFDKVRAELAVLKAQAPGLVFEVTDLALDELHSAVTAAHREADKAFDAADKAVTDADAKVEARKPATPPVAPAAK